MTLETADLLAIAGIVLGSMLAVVGNRMSMRRGAGYVTSHPFLTRPPDTVTT